MKLLLEIDDKTKAGKEVLSLIKELKKEKGSQIIREKKLTAKDLAQGIGRAATPNELKDVMLRASKSKTSDFDKAIDRLISE